MEASEFEIRPSIDTFPALWRRVMTDPQGFLAEMPQTGGLRPPTTFLVCCAVINAIGHLLTGWGIRGMIGVLVGQTVGAFAVAALFVLIAQNLFEGHAGFESTFRVVAYAAAPLVVFWAPFLGALAWLYSAYLIVRGIERVHGIDATRAVLTLVLGVGALWLLRAARTGGSVWF